MYRFKAQRSQQQCTTLHLGKGQSQVTVKTSRVQPAHLHHPQSNLILEFNIHENHDHSPQWSALEHSLQGQFEDIIATEVLPTSCLKTHVFVLSQDPDIESAIFNAVWLCLLLHGVPLRRSVFHFQWEDQQSRGKVVLDLLAPQSVLLGEYNSPPPDEAGRACREFKSAVLAFLGAEWSG